MPKQRQSIKQSGSQTIMAACADELEIKKEEEEEEEEDVGSAMQRRRKQRRRYHIRIHELSSPTRCLYFFVV